MDAELLAGMGLEGRLWVGHHLAGDLGGEVRGDAPALVDLHELLQLAFGATMDLLALAFELTLEQLGLGPHRHVLARRHRERAAEQTGESGERAPRRREDWRPKVQGSARCW